MTAAGFDPANSGTEELRPTIRPSFGTEKFQRLSKNAHILITLDPIKLVVKLIELRNFVSNFFQLDYAGQQQFFRYFAEPCDVTDRYVVLSFCYTCSILFQLQLKKIFKMRSTNKNT